MDYLLIIVLGIVVVSIWNSNRDAHERLREAIDRLEREIDFLRSQLAALVKANAKQAETKAAAPAAEAAAAKPEAPPQAAQAAHAVPTPVQGFPEPLAAKPAAAAPPTPAPATPPPPRPVQTPTPAAPQQSPVTQPPKPAAASPAEEARPIPQATPEKPPAPARPPVQAPAPPLHAPAPPVHAAAFQAAPAPTVTQQPSAKARLFSLEEALGANWLGKIGIALVVLGIASFLAWRFESWGPSGKVFCGFAVSILLLGGGVWLERKPTYRVFARGGIGGGWALAYFTTFAMYHLQAARILGSLLVDLVLMLLVAAGMVGHSLRYRSQTVTSLAFLLGFGTLLTSHLENPNQTVVFSLIASAILAIALVVVTTIRHWAVLELCGLIAVYVSHFVWLNEVLPANHLEFTEFWPSTALILLYWLIFRLAYVMRTPLDKREENLSSVSAILNSGGVLGLLKFQSAHPEWAFWALVAIGVFEMGLAYWAKSKRRQAFVVLSTIAVVLLVSSVPFRFHGVSWPVLWLVQAQVLAIAGLRLGEPVFRRLGLLVGVVTGGVLALHDVMPLAIERLMGADPDRHWSLTAGLALAAILYWTHAEVYPRRWPAIEANTIESLALRVSSWLALGAAATCLWVVLPNQWLPLGWIGLSLVLVDAGYRFRAMHPLLEGDVLALGTAGLLALNHVLPLAFFRMDHADVSRHPVETTVFSLAALAYWLRAEVFPRILPKPGAEGASTETLGGWFSFVLPCTSWLGLGAATAAMWVGLPDAWLPLAWVALFLVLVVVGHRFQTTMPALEGDVLALCAAGVMAFHHALPLVFYRFENADTGRHMLLTAVLSLSALAYWMRGELFPRFLPKLSANATWDPAAWEAVMLPVASCIGTTAAATAMWVALPREWVPVGWLAMVVVLGFAADWIASVALGLQADALAIAALAGLAGWDLWHNDWTHHNPVIAGVALLYIAMRRKTAAAAGNYVPAAYSWAAVGLLIVLVGDIVHHPWIAPVLAGLCAVLFEIGRFARKGFLRWQGYTLLAIAFFLYLVDELPNPLGGSMSAAGTKIFTLTGSNLLEALILIAAGYWLLERTRISERIGKAEHVVGMIADAVGTFCLVVWFGAQFPAYVNGGEGWIAAIWAGMATLLMALGWVMRRRTFVVQAIALALAAVLRGLFFDLLSNTQGDFWHGPLYRLSVTALVLIAALPFAFKLRGAEFWAGASIALPEPLAQALQHPEQWFFFAPFGMMVAALAMKLSSGHITIAWSLLGLGTFLFALVAGERSFRLAGLVLLLVSVAKIVLMDVWKLSTPDKIMTFIILGIALVAVSFLYTRFSATIRKYL